MSVAGEGKDETVSDSASKFRVKTKKSNNNPGDRGKFSVALKKMWSFYLAIIKRL